MRLPLLLAAACTLIAGPALAAPKAGDPLPRLVLSGEDEGLMRRVGDDDVAYARFDTGKTLARGKVYLLTYLAARRSAQKMSQPLKKALKSRPPNAKYQPVNFMNLDDCIFGTCGFARGQFEDHLHAQPTVVHVVDEEGRGRKLWGAQEEGVSVYVVDHTGVITHIARGPLTAASAQAVRDAIDAAVAKVP